jgi:hypothetical protein
LALTELSSGSNAGRAQHHPGCCLARIGDRP